MPSKLKSIHCSNVSSTPSLSSSTSKLSGIPSLSESNPMGTNVGSSPVSPAPVSPSSLISLVSNSLGTGFRADEPLKVIVLNSPPSLIDKSLTVNVAVYVIVPLTVRVVELEPLVALTKVGVPTRDIGLPLEDVIVSTNSRVLI